MRAALALLLLLLVSGPPLAAQETMVITAEGSAPAFACVEADCERLAWLPAGAEVTVIAEVEGREPGGGAGWHEVLLDCPCFDYEKRALADLPQLDPAADSYPLWHPDFSPAGERIAAVHESFLYIWDVHSGELLVKEMLDTFPLQYVDMSWSPDGERIAVAGLAYADGAVSRNVLLLLGPEGQPKRKVDLQEDFVSGVAWSNDGTRFLTLGDELRIRDGQQGTVLVTTDAPVTTAGWSPDDSRIVSNGAADQGGTLSLWDADNGNLVDMIDTSCHITWVNWSPDGSRIAWASIGKGCGGLHVYDVTSGNVSDSLAESGQAVHVSWSPDGRYLLANTGFSVQILDPTDGRVFATLADINSGFFPGLSDWSPTGDRIAIAGLASILSSQGERGRPTRTWVAHVWDLTLIPAGPTRAFVHGGRLGHAESADG